VTTNLKFWKHRARDRDSERRKLLNRDSKWNCVLFYYVNTLCFFVFFMYGQKGVKPDIRPGPLSRFRPTTQGRSMPHSQPLRPIPYPPSPASPCLPPRADTRHPLGGQADDRAPLPNKAAALTVRLPYSTQATFGGGLFPPPLLPYTPGFGMETVLPGQVLSVVLTRPGPPSSRGGKS